MNTLTLPPLVEVEKLLQYDPTTGHLIHKRSNGKAKAGDIAGYVTTRGYRVVSVKGKDYKAHRIAYLLGHKQDPGEPFVGEALTTEVSARLAAHEHGDGGSSDGSH